MSESNSTAARTNWANLITVLSAAILIATEVVGVAVASGWAIAGWLGLGDVGAYVLEGVFAAGGLAAVVSFVRAAARVEPFVDR